MARPIGIRIHRGSELLEAQVFERDIIKIGRLASAHLRLEDPKVSRIHAVIESQIERDELKVSLLFRKFKTLEIPADEIRRFDPEGRLFANLNRPEDLKSIPQPRTRRSSSPPSEALISSETRFTLSSKSR